MPDCIPVIDRDFDRAWKQASDLTTHIVLAQSGFRCVSISIRTHPEPFHVNSGSVTNRILPISHSRKIGGI
jgi:hypothetical protein